MLVIGAGPSGIVATKTLKERGYTVFTVDCDAQVGGTFRTKSYDDGRLVSSKYITAFSDLRFDADTEDHPTIDRYLKYLEDYCDAFELWQCIHFHKKVVQIAKNADEANGLKYSCVLRDLDTNTDETMKFHAICVCSGLHNTPFVPSIEGMNLFKGQVMHSSNYKTKSIFKDKRVLVLGCGETGLDLVYRAVQESPNVTLAVRSGFLSVPYAVGKHVPLDTFITNLCECSHLHPLVEKYKLKWYFTTPWIRLAFLIGTGSSTGFNQWAGCKASSQVLRGYQIINKSTDAMPFINRVPKSESMFGRMFSFLDKTEMAAKFPDRKIDVKRNIKSIVGDSKVEFEDGTIGEFDLIVLATGYKVDFDFMAHQRCSIKDDFPQDSLPTEHNILNPDEVSLAYIGFVRPNVGAIPPMSEMQVFYWISRLEGIIQRPTSSPSYRLLGRNPRTGIYAVDYGAYMHDLARDMKCEPVISDLLIRSPRSLLSWALGQAYVNFFRMRGTFNSANSQEICENELLKPVLERPFLSNVLFVSIIGIFGAFNTCVAVTSPLLYYLGA